MPVALFSVWDKTGLVDLATALNRRGWQFIASDGTALVLKQANLPVRSVSSLTGEPEMLDGRVKTLHPAVHAGLLARDVPQDRALLAERGWEPIDLVAVNLYPFEEIADLEDTTQDQALAMIDIGGVTLLRAAAKNFGRVTTLCDPADYPEALGPPDPAAFRQRMARKAFAQTSAYDDAIGAYLSRISGEPSPLHLTAYPTLELRYGENPHQHGAFFSLKPGDGPFGGALLQGKHLSYNNLLDSDVAWHAAHLFSKPTVVVVKHTSPCGIASAPSISDALSMAIASDPVSAFGSVIACSRPVDEDFVQSLGDLFVECIIAPDFSAKAHAILKARPNLRLLKVPWGESTQGDEFRSVSGGLLRQSLDRGDPIADEPWRVVTRRQPTDDEFACLRFAWKACQPVRSNAIVLARSRDRLHFTVGIGSGQPNRVDSVRIAGKKAGEQAAGAVLASDGFFPFPDGVEAAADLGVTAIVQPGGSRRDEEVIEAVDAAGLAMVLTGMRHFRH
jgi:phosphoribosylaminoimidazolecarboxamide formyltransferase/IMP cyclohydrolase